MRRDSKDSRTRWRNLVASLTVSVMLLIIGWGIWLYRRPPVVSVSNLKYVQILRTAISNKDSDVVSKFHAMLEKKKANQEITSTEANGFSVVVSHALEREWEAAEKACVALEKAQQNRNRD